MLKLIGVDSAPNGFAARLDGWHRLALGSTQYANLTVTRSGVLIYWNPRESASKDPHAVHSIDVAKLTLPQLFLECEKPDVMAGPNLICLVRAEL